MKGWLGVATFVVSVLMLVFAGIAAAPVIQDWLRPTPKIQVDVYQTKLAFPDKWKEFGAKLSSPTLVAEIQGDVITHYSHAYPAWSDQGLSDPEKRIVGLSLELISLKMPKSLPGRPGAANYSNLVHVVVENTGGAVTSELSIELPAFREAEIHKEGQAQEYLENVSAIPVPLGSLLPGKKIDIFGWGSPVSRSIDISDIRVFQNGTPTAATVRQFAKREYRRPIWFDLFATMGIMLALSTLFQATKGLRAEKMKK